MLNCNMDYSFTKKELDILDEKCCPHDKHFLPKESEEICNTNSTTTEFSVCTGEYEDFRFVDLVEKEYKKLG